MKFPLTWLKEYIDVDLPVDQIAKLLTAGGVEVDAIKQVDLEAGKAQDSIFEVSLTPNLGHCSSILGIARELSASTGKPVSYPPISIKESGNAINQCVSVDVEDSQRCPRYTCRLIQNVKIGPSPQWLQERLLACGIRPINVIVDITNYVSIEKGQPLHAFDFDKLDGRKVIVRNAIQGESLVTLDGRERTLEPDDVLICDSKGPVAIAGVMGGANSEVGESTCNVLLESACFMPLAIRRTSKRLGLQTDASKRFERSTDPNGIVSALDRASQLICELAGGEVCQGIIDIKESSFEKRLVKCRLTRINQLLGTQLGLSEVENIFHRLDFGVKWDGKDVFELKIPTYRADIQLEVDIIEEVARIYGYDHIPSPAPYYHDSTLPHAPIYIFENQVRNRLLSEGLQELLTCDLIGPSLINIAKEASMPEESTIRVLNPTSIEQSILRTSLLPGLLNVIKYNAAHQMSDLSGFEIGRIHFKDKENYKEQSVVGIIMTGKTAPHHWKDKPNEVDFFDLKGVVETLLNLIGIQNPIFKSNSLPSFHPGRQLGVYVESLEVGSLGEVHPTIVKRLDVPQRIYFAEINLHDLYKVHLKQAKVQPLAIFPSSSRDWTVTLSKQLSVAMLMEHMRQLATPLLEDVFLVDLYEDKALGAQVYNPTFRFVYRDNEKTVGQEAVDKEHWRLVGEINKLIEKRSKSCD